VQVTVAGVRPLRFEDGSPVRAASAVVAYDGGWLVVQDDATHACWLPSPSAVVGSRVRLVPAVSGRETFHGSTKHLKPDLEAACAIGAGVLLLGSGSTPARMSAVLLDRPGAEPLVADLTPLYARVAAALDVEPGQLNLEGACVLGPVLRWFHRGRPAGGLPSAAIDVPLEELVAAIRGSADAVALLAPTELDLGDGLAVTDAVALDERTVLVSAVLEDSPNAYDDGPVLASALALLVDGRVVDRVLLPEVDGRVAKVEGLAVREVAGSGVRLIATVDADDPSRPSTALDLRVTL
jgi:hypothetical protein